MGDGASHDWFSVFFSFFRRVAFLPLKLEENGVHTHLSAAYSLSRHRDERRMTETTQDTQRNNRRRLRHEEAVSGSDTRCTSVVFFVCVGVDAMSLT